MDCHVGDHVEREFGQVHVIGGQEGQVLPVAYDVPAGYPTMPEVSGGRVGSGFGVKHLQGLGDGFYRVIIDGCAGGKCSPASELRRQRW